MDHFSSLFIYFHRNNSYILTFCFSSLYWRAFGYTIFLDFPSIEYRNESEGFPTLSKPHTAIHVRNMDFPNLVLTLVAIVPVICRWSIQRRVTPETGDVWIHSLCLSNKVCNAATIYCLMPILNRERWWIYTVYAMYSLSEKYVRTYKNMYLLCLKTYLYENANLFYLLNMLKV